MSTIFTDVASWHPSPRPPDSPRSRRHSAGPAELQLLCSWSWIRPAGVWSWSAMSCPRLPIESVACTPRTRSGHPARASCLAALLRYRLATSSHHAAAHSPAVPRGKRSLPRTRALPCAGQRGAGGGSAGQRGARGPVAAGGRRRAAGRPVAVASLAIPSQSQSPVRQSTLRRPRSNPNMKLDLPFAVLLLCGESRSRVLVHCRCSWAPPRPSPPRPPRPPRQAAPRRAPSRSPAAQHVVPARARPVDFRLRGGRPFLRRFVAIPRLLQDSPRCSGERHPIRKRALLIPY